jgi:hypothetical protein
MTYLERMNADLDALAVLARHTEESMASYLHELCESSLVDLRAGLEGSQTDGSTAKIWGVVFRSWRDRDYVARNRRSHFLRGKDEEFASDLERFISGLRERIRGMPPSLLYTFFSELKKIRVVPPGGVPQRISVRSERARAKSPRNLNPHCC